ncbi:MAG: HEAT repeat domain-containing protein [Solirubrobacteraceae bacterium]|nr:HEAT repeat domain-containing protein [Solirubrobacteraceae bacterium]
MSLEDLLAAEPGSEDYDTQLAALHARPDASTFVAAAALLEDDDPARREAGVEVLAQLGNDPEADEAGPFHDEIVALFVELIAREEEPDVLAALATGFGHLDDDEAIGPLVALAGHEDPTVRHAVAFGLAGHEDDRAIAALIALTTDPSSIVRDWATHALGSQIEADTPEIREALFARLDDPDEDTQIEGIAGLAARGDERAIEPLLEARKTTEGLAIDTALYLLAIETAAPELEEEVREAFETFLDDHPDDLPPDDLQDAFDRYE